ncbi:MAG: DNA topoisomerase IV subunit A [Planctomycetota bacterium]
MSNVEPLMEQNFLEYASYVIVDRAFPDVRDGCKPVQRRILHTLFAMDDGKFHKVANVIGETMKLHPHGDASIGEALVVLANKEYFIEKQGNFGNVITGDKAAAARYIECRLTRLARETLFNKPLTEMQPSYDGRKQEPVVLPTKLPVVLMLGAEGIGVGMATRILPHNFGEILRAQVAYLRQETVELLPDFLHGGLMDAADYDEGRGKIRLRARIEPVGDKKVVIREIPYSTTTESLIASIENAAQKGKVKIGGINDFTTDHVEIELSLPRGIYAEEVVPQLYAYTDCEVSISSNLTVIRDGHPHEARVGELVGMLTDQLRETLRKELEWERAQLEDKRHWLTLEQIFIENRIYKRIEEATTDALVRSEVREGMMAFRALFVRDLVDEDIDRLLKIQIRRISRYDIEKSRKDIDDIVAAIAAIDRKLKRMRATTIAYLEHLLAEYADAWPRRTTITSFDSVDKAAVARSNLSVSYDKQTGFWGTAVRGDQFPLKVSEYDKILIVSKDGSYRIHTPEDKVLIPGGALHIEAFDEEQGAAFTVVYRDQQRNAFAKKVHIQRFVRGREYELIKDRAGSVEMLIPGDSDATVHCTFSKAKRQRLTECTFDLGSVEFGGIGIRGARMAPKPVARMKLLK